MMPEDTQHFFKIKDSLIKKLNEKALEHGILFNIDMAYEPMQNHTIRIFKMATKLSYNDYDLKEIGEGMIKLDDFIHEVFGCKLKSLFDKDYSIIFYIEKEIFYNSNLYKSIVGINKFKL